MASPIIIEADEKSCIGQNDCLHKSTKFVNESHLLEVDWIEIDSFAIQTETWRILKQKLLIFDTNGSMWGPDCVWCQFLRHVFGGSKPVCLLDPTLLLKHLNWRSFTSKGSINQRHRKGDKMISLYEKKAGATSRCSGKGAMILSRFLP